MNEISNTLEAIANGGSFSQGLVYALVAIVGCMAVSFVFRSVVICIFGTVAALYLVTLNAPDAAFAKDTVAADTFVNQLISISDCASVRVGNLQQLGVTLRNGDILSIATECGLLSK